MNFRYDECIVLRRNFFKAVRAVIQKSFIAQWYVVTKIADFQNLQVRQCSHSLHLGTLVEEYVEHHLFHSKNVKSELSNGKLNTLLH